MRKTAYKSYRKFFENIKMQKGFCDGLVKGLGDDYTVCTV